MSNLKLHIAVAELASRNCVTDYGQEIKQGNRDNVTPINVEYLEKKLKENTDNTQNKIITLYFNDDNDDKKIQVDFSKKMPKFSEPVNIDEDFPDNKKPITKENLLKALEEMGFREVHQMEAPLNKAKQDFEKAKQDLEEAKLVSVQSKAGNAMNEKIIEIDLDEEMGEPEIEIDLDEEIAKTPVYKAHEALNKAQKALDEAQEAFDEPIGENIGWMNDGETQFKINLKIDNLSNTENSLKLYDLLETFTGNIEMSGVNKNISELKLSIEAQISTNFEFDYDLTLIVNEKDGFHISYEFKCLEFSFGGGGRGRKMRSKRNRKNRKSRRKQRNQRKRSNRRKSRKNRSQSKRKKRN